MPQKIIIDTDPGQDDAVAILLALASPEDLDVMGIVAVAGNVGLNQNAKNALKIVELSGQTQTPVYAGCSQPMQRELVTAEHVHGESGLDGHKLPEPEISLQEQHGVDYLIETFKSAPAGEITICALGPLTNVATAMEKAPEIIPKIKEIVLMGGAYFEVGNLTPAAEFNIYVDPEAAHIVMHSGVPVTMIPLDASHQVLASPQRLKQLKSLGSQAGIAAANMLGFSERFDLDKYGWDGAPLHDPCVIAYLIEPQIFTGRFINVEIETVSELTRGMTVADYWGVTDREPNVNYQRNSDAGRFFALLMQRLARLP